jgi:hypothetical protein
LDTILVSLASSASLASSPRKNTSFYPLTVLFLDMKCI